MHEEDVETNPKDYADDRYFSYDTFGKLCIRDRKKANSSGIF